MFRPYHTNTIQYVLSYTYALARWIIWSIVGLIVIHIFIATIFIVDGPSMDPNLATNDFMLVNKIAYLTSNPNRGDIVVLKFPGDPEHKKYIKRIIGLPGEKVQIINGTVYINDQKLNEKYLPNGMLTLPNVNRTLRDDDYFLLGDNRPNSSDSRTWGISPKRYLIGRAAYTIWPLNLKGIILQPSY